MMLCMVPDERSDMALKEAHDLGYRTVFCGEEENQHTRDESDVYYVVDWSDDEALYNIALKEKVCGIVGLSDRTVESVARLTERLGLPGSPESSMTAFLSKAAFMGLIASSSSLTGSMSFSFSTSALMALS